MPYRKAALSELDIMKASMQVIAHDKSLDELDLGEYGESTQELKDAVRGKIARLFGIHQTVGNSEAPADAVVATPAIVPAAPESLESVLKNLEAQYPKMVATLKAYEISFEGMPAWEVVKAGLTPEVLTKALKLEKPTLLLVPPVSRQAMVAAINKHPISRQKNDTNTYELDSDDLWNGGKQEEKNWRIMVVEGVQEVAKDSKITKERARNDTMTDAYIKKYAAQKLDVINDARTYLTLMMSSLQADEPIDQKTWTVLNGETRKKDALLSYGPWSDGQVNLSSVVPVDENSYLRLRAAARVA